MNSARSIINDFVDANVYAIPEFPSVALATEEKLSRWKLFNNFHFYLIY